MLNRAPKFLFSNAMTPEGYYDFQGRGIRNCAYYSGKQRGNFRAVASDNNEYNHYHVDISTHEYNPYVNGEYNPYFNVVVGNGLENPIGNIVIPDCYSDDSEFRFRWSGTLTGSAVGNIAPARSEIGFGIVLKNLETEVLIYLDAHYTPLFAYSYVVNETVNFESSDAVVPPGNYAWAEYIVQTQVINGFTVVPDITDLKVFRTDNSIEQDTGFDWSEYQEV